MGGWWAAGGRLVGDEWRTMTLRDGIVIEVEVVAFGLNDTARTNELQWRCRGGSDEEEEGEEGEERCTGTGGGGHGSSKYGGNVG